MKLRIFLIVGIMIMASFVMISFLPKEAKAYPLNNFGTGVATGLPTTGEYNFSAEDHNGLTEEAFVMVRITKGDWEMLK